MSAERTAPGREAGAGVTSLDVIVACTGHSPDLLAAQLRSLAAQDHDGAWQVILADNGMSDATRAVALAFAARLPGFTLLDLTGRRGKSYAVNAAVAATGGSHLVLLDADDVVAPGYLRHLADALAVHDFVGGRLDSDTLNEPWLRSRRAPMQDDGLETLLGYRPVVIGAAMAMRRGVFEAVGGFDETLRTQVDVDLSWRLGRAGFEPAFVPDAVVAYRYRGDMRGIFAQERGYGRGEAVLYAKHHPDGLPRRPLRRTVRGWLDVALALPGTRTRAGRARLATVTGAALGRLEGSILNRVPYL